MESSKAPNKFELYQKSVQNAKKEAEFFRKVFRLIFNKVPETFREDFCGTGLLSCEWVKNNVMNSAIGLDIDQETLDWGTQNNVNNLSSGSDRVKQTLADKKKIIEDLQNNHLTLIEKEALQMNYLSTDKSYNKSMIRQKLMPIIIVILGLFTYKNINMVKKKYKMFGLISLVFFLYNMKERTLINSNNLELNKKFEKIFHIKL